MYIHYRVKVKLGNKVGMVPDNFIEIKKETAKVPTPPLPSREETNPPTAKENEVRMCVHACMCLCSHNRWDFGCSYL